MARTICDDAPLSKPGAFQISIPTEGIGFDQILIKDTRTAFWLVPIEGKVLVIVTAAGAD
jgi:hypothetical protein